MNIKVSAKKDLNKTELNVIDILAQNKITMSVQYLGEGKFDEQSKYLSDEFVITFKDSDTQNAVNFPFFQGIGHRKVPKKDYNPTIIYRPSEADILYCLCLDLLCGELSFSEFCNEYSYNYDSIKDLNLHRTLEQQAKKVRKFFKCIDQIIDAVQDY